MNIADIARLAAGHGEKDKFTSPKSNGFDIGQMPVPYYRPSSGKLSRVAIGRRNT